MDYTAIVKHALTAAPTLQKEEELVLIAKIVHQLLPKTIVELGVFRGGSLHVWMMMAHEEARAVGVDVPGEHSEEAVRNLTAWCPPKQKFLHLTSNTQNPESATKALAFLQGPIDYLCIDASHDYKSVRTDFNLWSPYVRKGGIINVNDTYFSEDPKIGVWKLWKELKAKYRCEDFPAGSGLIYVE